MTDTFTPRTPSNAPDARRAKKKGERERKRKRKSLYAREKERNVQDSLYILSTCSLRENSKLCKNSFIKIIILIEIIM